MTEEIQKKPTKSLIAEKEEKVLAFWQEKQIFKKSVDRPAKEDFVFFDGPPFANGLPHYGHLLASFIKDTIPRYQTMLGKRVVRKWGWDCHGLPVENLIEKELGLRSRKDIETMGVGRFNDAARESVLRYAEDWRATITRLGRFVDMEDDYRTMDATYTETIWWIFKSLYDKKLAYEGFKSMHLCPRCETTLSNFEVNQGYKDITDISVTVEFELLDSPPNSSGQARRYMLAWTTTPWTLPGNVALAVNGDIEYVEVEGEEAGNTYIVAKARVEKVFAGKYKLIRTFLGKELIGKSYKPVFNYYSSKADLKNRENGWKVYGADFVTTEDGTGVVHSAPAFGEDDLKLGREKELPFVQHVGTDGAFRVEVVDFAGLQVKPKDDHQRADVEIIKYLAREGSLFAKEKLIHSYPHCWRCDTPLLNYAASSWFVKVTDLKDKLVAVNKKISWVPREVGEGRFGNWLLGARDWAISRSRYWGAPLPVWKCNKCDTVEVLGGVSDIRSKTKASNNYFLMRHGEAESNVLDIASTKPIHGHHLTDIGRVQVENSAKTLVDKHIDLIITSNFIRAEETAKIVASKLGLIPKQIVIDERLGEVNAGVYDMRPWKEYREFFKEYREHFTRTPKGAESFTKFEKELFLLCMILKKHTKERIFLLLLTETHHGYFIQVLSV
jgi:isoleucyl-tRNA synthetase